VMLVYADSCILIYYLDHKGDWNARATAKLDQLAVGGDRIATSDLVRLECRVKPINTGDADRLAVFDTFFSRPDIQRVSITTPVFDRATTIRATFGFRLGDSLHLAAAVESGCDSFLTNDARLAAFMDIPVEALP